MKFYPTMNCKWGDKNMSNFHERIYELYEEARDEDHKTGRKRFAELCGVTLPQINGWLNKKCEPDSETMKKIAAKRNVSVSWLVGETNIRNFHNFTEYSKMPPGALIELEIFMRYLKFRYHIENNE